MILFVVLGHLIEVTAGWQSGVGESVMEAIFMIHMPAFIFMAGMTFNHYKVDGQIISVSILIYCFPNIILFILHTQWNDVYS